MKSLAEINKELDQKAQKVAQNKAQEREQKGYISSDTYFLYRLAKEIAQILDLADDAVQLSPIPAHLKGDLALKVPSLMQEDIQKYKNELLPQMQKKLEAQQKELGLLKVELVLPYLNLSLDYSSFADQVLTTVMAHKERYGETDAYRGQKVLIDYSSPNVAKTMHIGHLRSTIVGQVLVNISEACGYTVLGVNHLGDWGTQFGKLAVAYEDCGQDLEKVDRPVKFLSDLYAQFSQEAKKNEQKNDQSRMFFARLEQGNEELLAMWQMFKKVSMIEFERMYKRMNIHIDLDLGESFYEAYLPAVIQECLDKGIARQEGQAVIIDLGDEKKFPTFLLVKSDGATSYITRDIATFKYREEVFQPNLLLYVVGNEQKLHFRQLFETMKQLGDNPQEKAIHVGLGMMNEQGKKISSREGAGGLEDLLDRVVEQARANMEESDRGLSDAEKDQIAEQIALGAIFYNDLKNGHAKNIDFDIADILSMKGKSGPYLQYAQVRAQSILAKAGDLPNLDLDWSQADKLTEIEQKLLQQIARFPEYVLLSAQNHAPHHLAIYLDELAQSFNSFHHQVHVLNSEGDLKEIRKLLVFAVGQVLQNGLRLLNIPLPKRM